MRSEDRKPSKRVFPLLQNLDLDTVTFANVQGVGDSITIEDMNEQELQDLVLVNLARLCVSSEWTGLLEAGGTSFPLEADAGSTSAPSYSFSDDTNTGMFLISDQMIGFVSNGSRQLAVYQNYLRLEGTSNPQIINCDANGVDLELRSGGASYGKIRVGRENYDIEIDPSGTGKAVIHSPQFGSSDPPASSGATGTAGQLAYDSSYLYICTATDTWERVAVATW